MLVPLLLDVATDHVSQFELRVVDPFQTLFYLAFLAQITSADPVEEVSNLNNFVVAVVLLSLFPERILGPKTVE